MRLTISVLGHVLFNRLFSFIQTDGHALVHFLTDFVQPGLFYKHLQDSFNLGLNDPFPPNLPGVIIPDRQSQGSDILRECSPPAICQMSHVKCHVFHVRCHLSGVKGNFCLLFRTNCCNLSVQDLLLVGPTLSSFQPKIDDSFQCT